MGSVHYPKGALIFDGTLDTQNPEILIYEQRCLWASTSTTSAARTATACPPSTSCTCGRGRAIPPGAFVDWHPDVSCEEFVGE
jgi:hypothetical protein